MLADVTSDLIDHLTVFLIIAALCVAALIALWMLMLFLLSRHRYPEY